ncbi:hypothetical protein [Massilia sp. BSC265]|uniref:hypothetical protein n=1 Tax=Massilia sp. BSC265 TaxID=1549812 RepID=UPI00126A086B|nr:hypothetical protein [Massilia sp. BSC265]
MPAGKKIQRTILAKPYREIFDLHQILPNWSSAPARQSLPATSFPTWNCSWRRNHVGAVYQNASSDNGKTWSFPTLTDEAELFEIGKSFPSNAMRGVWFRNPIDIELGRFACTTNKTSPGLHYPRSDRTIALR